MQSTNDHTPHKIFLLAGEASGDRLAAWYINKYNLATQAELIGIGGVASQAAGVKLYMPMDTLTAVGVIEIVPKLWHFYRLVNQIVDFIDQQNITEVVLVDFPGFNLWVARRLKARNKNITITYLSPPQMWAWGSWRVKKIQRYIDTVAVIYPFEVAWFAARGVTAQFVGNPVYDELCAPGAIGALSHGVARKKDHLVLFPGSRKSEITALMSRYVAILKNCFCQSGQTSATVYISIAPSLSADFVHTAWQLAGGDALPVTVVTVGHHEREQLIGYVRTAWAVLTKPGTNTLEIALLGSVPVVIYKTSWVTYWLARMVVTITTMSLPNIIAKERLVPEFIQGELSVVRVGNLLAQLREQALAPEARYYERCNKLHKIQLYLLENSVKSNV